MALDPALDSTFEAASKYYDLDPDLVKSVAGVESSGDPRAVSPKGAVGEMQLMPKTAADMGVTDRTDPVQSIWGGTRYLAQGIAEGEKLAGAGQPVDPLTYGLMYYHGGPDTSIWGPATQAYPGLIAGRYARVAGPRPGGDGAAGGDGGGQPAPAPAPADDGLAKLTRAGTPATTDTGLPPYLLQIERDANAAAGPPAPAGPRPAGIDKLAAVNGGPGGGPGGGPQLGPVPGQENLFAPVSMDTGSADSGLPSAPSGLETRLGGPAVAAAPGGPPPSGGQAPPVSFPGAPPAPAAAAAGAPGRAPGTVPPIPSPETIRAGAAPQPPGGAAGAAGGGAGGSFDQPPPGATPVFDLEKIQHDALIPEAGDRAAAMLNQFNQYGMPYRLPDGSVRYYPVPGQQEVIAGKAEAEQLPTRTTQAQEPRDLPGIGVYYPPGSVGAKAAVGSGGAETMPDGGVLVRSAPPQGQTESGWTAFNKLRDASDAARDGLFEADQLKQTLNAIQTTGPLTEVLSNLRNYATQIGVDPKWLDQHPLIADPTKVVEANKLKIDLLSAILHKQFPGQRLTNMDIMTMSPTVAGPETPIGASNYLIDQILKPQMQQSIDRYNNVAGLPASGDRFLTTLPQVDNAWMNNPSNQLEAYRKRSVAANTPAPAPSAPIVTAPPGGGAPAPSGGGGGGGGGAPPPMYYHRGQGGRPGFFSATPPQTSP